MYNHMQNMVDSIIEDFNDDPNDGLDQIQLAKREISRLQTALLMANSFGYKLVRR